MNIKDIIKKYKVIDIKDNKTTSEKEITLNEEDGLSELKEVKDLTIKENYKNNKRNYTEFLGNINIKKKNNNINNSITEKELDFITKKFSNQNMIDI